MSGQKPVAALRGAGGGLGGGTLHALGEGQGEPLGRGRGESWGQWPRQGASQQEADGIFTMSD